MNKVLFNVFIIAIVFLTTALSVFAQYEEDLGTIVITATRIGQSDYQITGDVTVIDREQIQASNAKSVPDVLKEVLSVNVYDNSTSKTSKLDIRGFGETAVNNVLFLVNDRKTNSIDMSGTDLLQIPIESVERIEIIRGAGSVLYGDNAVGGVVNIITKKGKGDFKGNVGMNYGSYDRRSTFVEASGDKKGLSYYLYSKYADDRGYRENSDVLAKDFSTRIGYKFSEKLSLDLESSWHEDEYGQPGSLTDAQLVSLGRRGTANPDDRAKTRDRFVNFSFDLNPWPEDIDFGDLVFDFNFRNRDSYSDNVAWSMDTKNTIDTVGINGKYVFNKTVFNKDVNFVTGIDYYDNENDIIRTSSGSVTDITISKQEFGIYGFLEYELVDNIFVNGGTRFQTADYTFNQKDGSNDLTQSPEEWVSMGGLKYEYAKGSNVFANIQQMFRFLATDEWFNTISGVLNTSLEQQTGIQYEAGIKHNFNDIVVGNLTAYLIDTKNEIYYNPTGGNFGWGDNENYDKTRRIGFEIGSRFDLLTIFDIQSLDKMEFFANYNYQNPEFLEGDYEGKMIPLVANHQGNAGLLFKFMKNYNLSLTGRVIGSRYAGSDTSNALSMLKAYCVLDGKIAYKKESFEVYAEVNNLLDEQYSTYVSSYGTTKYYYPAPETNFNVGVNLKF